MKRESINEVSLEKKKSFTLPEGATIISQSERVTVREIENGFIMSKSFDIKYQVGDDNNYEYYTKEWFSKDNPVQITMPKEKSLAEKLD